MPALWTMYTPLDIPPLVLIAMALIGECRGWQRETELLSCWKEYRALFHYIPSHCRFNRRRRNVMPAFNLIRQGIRRGLDVSMEKQTIFGQRLHLLITLGGLILDCEMTPANAADAGSWF